MTDPLIAAARFLLTQLEWLRHSTDQDREPFAATALPEIDECARIVRRIARGSRGRIYRGPCGAPQIPVEPEVAEAQGIHPANVALGLAPCDGDVYAYPGAESGRCDLCGAEYPESERKPWLNGLVADEAFPAIHIADAYDVRANTIRVWADRHLIRTWYRHEGRLVEWTSPHEGEDVSWRGPRLYLVAEVKNRMHEAKIRQAEREAEHERRKAHRDRKISRDVPA